MTRRALEDLGASDCSASDLRAVARVSPHGEIVDKFAKMRTAHPTGTEAPLSKVHRGDVYKLDGRDGQRAVTWHDATHGVVWFLAFTPNHNYDLFVSRAARPEKRGLGGSNQLMPSVQDYEDLSDERSTRDFTQVANALEMLVAQAREEPDTTVRGQLAKVIRAEAHVVTNGDARRLHLRFRMPPLVRGILFTGFEYTLIAALDGVIPETIGREPFPAGTEHGATLICADLLI